LTTLITILHQGIFTRSQTVAMIADRTALQHLWSRHDVIGHVTV